MSLGPKTTELLQTYGKTLVETIEMAVVGLNLVSFVAVIEKHVKTHITKREIETLYNERFKDGIVNRIGYYITKPGRYLAYFISGK